MIASKKEYLLVVNYCENGKTDIEWHETLEDARKSAKQYSIVAHDYEIYHAKGVLVVEKDKF